MELERSHKSFDIPKLLRRYSISYNALIIAFKEAQKQHHSKATKALYFLNYIMSGRLTMPQAFAVLPPIEMGQTTN